MSKKYIITFCISFLVLATVVVIVLMILLPQHTTVIKNNTEEYSTINDSNYSFVDTKAISFENLVTDYSISRDQMQLFKNNNQFVPGNSDPFSVNGGGNVAANTGEGSGTGTSGSTNTPTQDKITNSNGGVSNPDATTK